jgi:hypothetical protein
MLSIKKIYFMIFPIFCSFAVFAQEQETVSTKFRLVAELGSGYSYKLTEPKTTLGIYTRDGIAGTVRLKWGSSNLLGIGIETGWIPVSSTKNSALLSEFGTMNVSAALSAVPVLAVFSIQRMGIQLHTGLGYYRMSSTVTIAGSTMQSSEWNLGYLLSLGYARPLFSNYGLGGEVKWNSIVEQQVSIISFQIRLIYRLYGD